MNRPPTCPKLHYCTFIKSLPPGYQDSFMCDRCQTERPENFGVWHCFVCDAASGYDICNGCHPRTEENDVIPPLSWQVTAEQQAKIDSVRTSVIAAGFGDLGMSDFFYYRFLCDAKWDVDRAVALSVETAEWRQAQKIPTLLREKFPKFDLINMIAPAFLHGYDKGGRPIHIVKVSAINLQLLQDLTSPDDYRLKQIYLSEQIMDVVNRQSEILRRRVEKFVIIADLTGLTLSHTGLVPYVNRANEENRHYPVRIHKIFFINASVMFPPVWELAKLFLEEDIQKAVSIHSDDAKAQLAEAVDLDQLPNEFGGTCQCRGAGVPCIPKNDPVDIFKAAARVDGFTRKRINAGTELVRDVEYGAGSDGHVWWSFELASNDIEFSVQVLDDHHADSSLAESLDSLHISPPASPSASDSAASASPTPTGSPMSPSRSVLELANAAMSSAPLPVPERGTTLLEPARLSSHRGWIKFHGKSKGTLRFKWNNSYSWVNAKDLRYALGRSY